MHESGQELVSEFPVPLDGNIQKLGSYLTYAKRYSWAAICGIDSGDGDDDGNSVADQPKPAAKKNNAGDFPNSPDKMLAFINQRVLVTYDHPKQMYNVVKKHCGREKWPGAGDIDGWREVYACLKEYADSKTETPEAPQDDGPLFDTQGD